MVALYCYGMLLTSIFHSVHLQTQKDIMVGLLLSGMELR